MSNQLPDQSGFVPGLVSGSERVHIEGLETEVAQLRDRLSTFNECVRIYLQHDGQVRSGWLEEEVDATDALLSLASDEIHHSKENS